MSWRPWRLGGSILPAARQRFTSQPSLLATLLLLIAFACPAEQRFDDAEVAHIAYPDWFVDNGLPDFTELLSNTAADGKQGVMLLFTTEGCSYCDLFIRTSLADPALAARVQANFSAIGLEIFDDTDMIAQDGTEIAIKTFADEQGAEFAPTLLFYANDGSRILRMVGYQDPERFGQILDYLIAGHYQGQTFREYLSQRNTTATTDTASLRDDPLFSEPPYALDRRYFPASQPLLVLFEQPGAAAVSRFHDEVLSSDQVRGLLSQFELVRLDSGDADTPVLTPNGQRTNPRAWYRQTGFSNTPALLFFDETGKPLLQTDALVLRQRMLNSLNFVLERAYDKGWSYQRYARSRGIERQTQEQDRTDHPQATGQTRP